MTPTERAALVDKIAATWPGGPEPQVWADELALLDAGRAGATFVRLRRRLDRAPSIAAFLREYNGLDTAPPASTVDVCGICDDTGWVDGAPLIKRNLEGDVLHTYTSMRPCPVCDDHLLRVVVGDVRPNPGRIAAARALLGASVALDRHTPGRLP